MNKTTLGIIAIALAAILSVGLAGYTTLTPLTATETQEQHLTKTELLQDSNPVFEAF